MPQGPRYLPPGWSVEVTTRTICGFYLLPATSKFARIIVGILCKAQEKYPVQIHAAVATSNHYYLILTPDDAEQPANFMEYFNGNLAREAGRLIDWRGSFWADRYHLIPISPEPEALIERLRYVLSNTVKESLVAKVSDWKGLHCGEAPQRAGHSTAPLKRVSLKVASDLEICLALISRWSAPRRSRPYGVLQRAEPSFPMSTSVLHRASLPRLGVNSSL